MLPEDVSRLSQATSPYANNAKRDFMSQYATLIKNGQITDSAYFKDITTLEQILLIYLQIYFSHSHNYKYYYR